MANDYQAPATGPWPLRISAHTLTLDMYLKSSGFSTLLKHDSISVLMTIENINYYGDFVSLVERILGDD